jgi:hypothetical protein
MKSIRIRTEETARQSWKADASTWALALACFLPGWALDIRGLMYFGGFAFWAALIGIIIHGLRKDRMTPQEAADWLAKEHNVRAKGEQPCK